MLLRSQGAQYGKTTKALWEGDLDKATITPAERLLLEFVRTLTLHAYRITDEQVQGLRNVGWSEEQIAETVYDASLFNMLVRLADAFGLRKPDWMNMDELLGMVENPDL